MHEAIQVISKQLCNTSLFQNPHYHCILQSKVCDFELYREYKSTIAFPRTVRDTLLPQIDNYCSLVQWIQIFLHLSKGIMFPLVQRYNQPNKYLFLFSLLVLQNTVKMIHNLGSFFRFVLKKPGRGWFGKHIEITLEIGNGDLLFKTINN